MKRFNLMPSLGEKLHDPTGCHWGGRPHLGPCVDRSTEAGRALAEVRTVLSRAETARQTLIDSGPLEWQRLPKPLAPAGCVNTGEPPRDPDGRPFDDPDLSIMIGVLGQVIDALSPWARRGKTTHWVADDGPAQLVTAAPDDVYEAEVGDEMSAGQMAVLAELRERLARTFLAAPNAQHTMLGVIDGYAAEMVAQQIEDADEGDWEECGAVYADPDRPGLPAQPPCGKRAKHWLGPATDWKRDYHSNGSLKWAVTDQEREAGGDCRAVRP